MAIELHIQSLADTDRLGFFLSQTFQAGACMTLQGPLGVGKSELARAMIKAGCGETGDMPSPTFTLVQSYEMTDGTPVWHMDLYRLKGLDDVLALGIEDAFYEAVCLIEWPDRLDGFLPHNTVSIDIDFLAGSETERRIIIDGPQKTMSQLSLLTKDLLVSP